MSITRNLVMLAAVSGLAGAASADVILSTFEGGDEGWLIADGNAPQNQSLTVSPEYFPSGGNNNGFITTALDWATTAFFVAPGEYLGDQSDKFGGSITVDRRFVHPDSWTDTMQVDYAVDMTMSDLAGTMTLAVDLDPVSLEAWGSFEVELSAAGGWVHLDTGVAATDSEIAALLADMGDVRVRGNIRDTFGRVAIDNFSLVPTPGTTGVLALAGLAAIRRRR